MFETLVALNASSVSSCFGPLRRLHMRWPLEFRFFRKCQGWDVSVPDRLFRAGYKKEEVALLKVLSLRKPVCCIKPLSDGNTLAAAREEGAGSGSRVLLSAEWQGALCGFHQAHWGQTGIFNSACSQLG